jgi:carboxymethylenebutenolidase
MSMITMDTTAGPARAYLAPAAGGRGPGVLVMHAWWGLNDAFTGVADRLAAEGFVALAPDLYQGRIAQTIEEAKALREQLDLPRMEAAARAAVGVLQAQPGVDPKRLGAMGFSMGGEWSGLLSDWYPEALRAMVLVYGAAPADFTVARAAVQGHFAEVDEWESLDYVRHMEAAMRAAGREVTIHVYPGVGHWFFEPNRPDVYDAEASRLVWERTLAFLRQKLSGPS